MSIGVLVQVYDEARRLAVAGSVVAPGDFRLKKLVAPLQQSGEKAPVFAKIATAAQAVVDSDETTAAAALLELTTLVTAVLYTQGTTGAAGEFEAIASTDLGPGMTQTNARLIKPLLDALSTTGSGRLEVVKDAFERGAFQDLRLVLPALTALDDPYPEIGEFVAEKVLPLYGRTILPQLRAALDVKARGGHVHRLRLLHRLDTEGSADLVQATLEDGSKEMRVAAVECLTPSGQGLTYLLEQAKSKARDVRAAALRALARGSDATADLLAALKKAIAGDDLDLLGCAIGRLALPDARAFVLRQAKQELADLLKPKDKDKQAQAIARLRRLIALAAKQDDAAGEAFVLDCFEKADALAGIRSEPSGADLNEWVAHLMARGTPRSQKRLADAARTLSGGAFQAAADAARRTTTPAAFYDAFAPLLRVSAAKRTKANSADHDRGRSLLGVLTGGTDYLPSAYRRWLGGDFSPAETARLPDLDPRWLDAALDAGATDLVYKLARPGHAGVERFLTEQAAKPGKAFEAYDVLQAMVRTRHPQAAEAIVKLLQKQAKDATSYYDHWIGRMIPDLPKSDAAKFDALLPTLPDKMADRLADYVQALKDKPE